MQGDAAHVPSAHVLDPVHVAPAQHDSPEAPQCPVVPPFDGRRAPVGDARGAGDARIDGAVGRGGAPREGVPAAPG